MSEVQVHGIGSVAKKLILKAHAEGKQLTNEQLAAKVVEIFAAKNIEVKTGAASIAWYKNDLRKKGQLPKGAMSGGAKSIAFDIESVEFE